MTIKHPKIKHGDVIAYPNSGYNKHLVYEHDDGNFRRIPLVPRCSGSTRMTQLAKYIVLYNIADIIEDIG